MRLLILAGLIAGFGLLLLLGLRDLVRDLSFKDFFHEPTLPSDRETS